MFSSCLFIHIFKDHTNDSTNSISSQIIFKLFHRLLDFYIVSSLINLIKFIAYNLNFSLVNYLKIDTVAMHLGSIFRPEVLCPFDTAHIETAVSLPSYLLVWCIIHFHHFKYHDPYNDSLMLTLCIHPWQLGRCGYRLPALSHCFTPFITYRAFRGRDITNGYDSVETHFKQRPSGRTYMV